MTLTKIGSLFTVCAVALFGFTQDAAAININTPGAACQNYIPSQVGDMDYNAFGLRNINAADRTVVCPVARSPLAPGAGQAGFFVDGSNPGGKSTSCTIYSYNYNGMLLGSKTFNDAATHYDHYDALPAAQATPYAYITVLCTLPSGGTLLGVTAVQ